MSKKMNCWEFKNCRKVFLVKNRLITCPVITYFRQDGINNGKNAGRVCWTINNTFCNGAQVKDVKEKISKCFKCEFYLKVKEEEGKNFILAPSSQKFPSENNENEINNNNKDKGCISLETKNLLVEKSRIILEKIENNEIPSMEEWNEVTETINKQITDKIKFPISISKIKIIDNYTYSHTINVAITSSIFAKFLGYSKDNIKTITLAGFAHDIGKIKIPQSILNKKEKLSYEEMKVAKKHTIYGYEIAQKIPLPEIVCKIVLNHHERLDGSGYPNKIKENQISAFTQLISIIDVYDSLTSDKSYKQKVSPSEALNLMLLEGRNALNLDLLYQFSQFISRTDAKMISNVFKKNFL